MSLLTSSKVEFLDIIFILKRKQEQQMTKESHDKSENANSSQRKPERAGRTATNSL